MPRSPKNPLSSTSTPEKERRKRRDIDGDRIPEPRLSDPQANIEASKFTKDSSTETAEHDHQLHIVRPSHEEAVAVGKNLFPKEEPPWSDEDLLRVGKHWKTIKPMLSRKSAGHAQRKDDQDQGKGKATSKEDINLHFMR